MSKKKSRRHVRNRASNTQQSSTTEGICVHNLNKLPEDLQSLIGLEWLEPQDTLRLQKEARVALYQRNQSGASRLQLFDPLINDIAPGYAVLTGRPERLKYYLEKDPSLFFKKTSCITGPGGQAYYHVSPADLILFLGEDDMQNQVHEWAKNLPEADEVREHFFKQWKAHQASKGRGGADVVMLSGDYPPDFARIREVTDTFVIDGRSVMISRKLLSNPNGIVCWKDSNDQLHWYYADKEKLNEIEISEAGQHEPDYVALCKQMKSMEPDTPTARRLSDKEHHFFEAHAKIQVDRAKQFIKIHREGIRYRQQDGTEFRDTQYDTHRVLNAYIKCRRLYGLAEAETHLTRRVKLFNKAHNVLCTELAYEQRGLPLHFIQSICKEEGSLVRSLIINNHTRKPPREELLFDINTGQFCKDFGSRFAIAKGMMFRAASSVASYVDCITPDLIALIRLITDAYNNVQVRDFEAQVPAVDVRI